MSVIGFGFFSQILLFKSIKNINEEKTIYYGFYGLFLITLISLITSLVVSHNFIHNLALHFFGILFFIIIKIENKKIYLKNIILITIFTIIAILISKTHDDFSYYHLPFTKYLTEHKIIFGMSNLGHGYKLLSSLFFLNSTFYLPKIEYYTFHFSILYFLIFFNYFIFNELFSKDNHEIVKYLYLFALAFFNLSFNRIAEYGTDKVGQLLIVLLVIKIFQITCFKNEKHNLNNILLLIPLVGFCLTLKTYFFPYLLIACSIFFFDKRFFYNLKKILFSKFFFILVTTLSIYLFHNFVSTGCIISPLSFTCLGENFNWAYDKEHYQRLSNWLEQWSKAGAGPNFRIENPATYIQNFNWVPRWFEFYFMGKVKDQLSILILIFLIIFLLFKKFKKKSKILISTLEIGKKILFFYFIILIIFIIWFTQHPQLRYGGYSIVFLTISIPIALLFYKFKNQDKKNFVKKIKLLSILIIVIFNSKNIMRINKEINRTDYFKYENFPFFALYEKEYIYENTSSGLRVYKTKGHCWNTPSPCVMSLEKLDLKTIKKNGYYFFYR
ncbi:hypothetical protein OAN46_01215 [Candidatus Pelagibacter sp.]|nr:hypothetical protein [Candidatus Pelagibacter sp.]